MHKYTQLMADTIMRKYPDADSYPYKSWSYPQGFMLWGFIRLYEKTGEHSYLDYILGYCDKHAGENGELAAFTGVSLDDIMTGSVIVWAYAKTKKENYLRASKKIRRAFDDYPRNSDGGFWHSRELPHEMWVDGLFMGLMFLTRYGAFIGDKDFCFAETVRQLSTVFDVCEKDGSGLLYHGYSEDRLARWAHPITGKSPEIWCEGLGWYALVLPEVLELLPKDYPGYERLHMQLNKLIAGLLKVQDDSSGLWYQVVDKPRYSRNWHDTSGSAMFLYCIKKSGLMGLYDSETCESASQKAFQGLKAKCTVDCEGNANIHDACNGLCVQDSYDAYVGYARNINCQEAVAAFFWASQIMEYGL